MKDLHGVLDHISDGIMEIDGRGVIVYCNQKVMSLDDIDSSDVVGKPLLAVYPSLNPQTSTLFQVLETGKPIYNMSQTFVTYRGKTIATVNTTLPVFEGQQVIGAIEISRDITDVKAMSERIADLQRRVFAAQGRVEHALGDYVQFNFDSIITEDFTVLRLKEMGKKAALTSSPVLVCGETGTGKELFVQAIHAASRRRDGAFIAQNCAALPANLLEGILFGTADGAYTGAKDRVGLLETASGGTLFLDEINSMPLELQAKLLRFLQDGWLRRLGDTSSRKVDVRVIAAMNVTAKEAVERGMMRQDLLYRLNTITLEIPPLRARRGDIGLLVPLFVDRFNRQLGRGVHGLTREVLQCFDRYDWPGNVRELEHVIEGAIHMCDGEWITLADLPPTFFGLGYGQEASQGPCGGPGTGPGADGVTPCQEGLTLKLGVPLDMALMQYERQIIRQAKLMSGGNVSDMARLLGIPRQTLQYKLKKMEE